MNDRLDQAFQRGTPHFLAGIGTAGLIVLILTSLMDHPVFAAVGAVSLAFLGASYLTMSGRVLNLRVDLDDARKRVEADRVWHEFTGEHPLIDDEPHGRHSS